MFRRTTLATSLAAAFGGVAMLAVTTVTAQTTPAPAQRIEITGSNIKRIDAETVAPVTVITREQIERTGQPTVADVLRNIPSNSGGSFGESFSNSFAPGAAGISLRGLGQKTTLVLINGRRVAGYGFAQNLQDTFVDLNSIPTSAVDRIDILRDGASAIYGSDAIAGVVNVILRKDFRGFEGNVAGTTFDGKKEYRASIGGGFGDLASDKFNIFGTLDVYHRDLLMQEDTKLLQSRDLRGQDGGRNFQSLTGGGTWRQLTAANGLTNTYRAISGCTGTVMTGPQAVEAGLINPVGATNLATAAATNTFCTYDFKNQFTALPGTDRVSSLIRANIEVSPTATAFVELGLSRNKTEQTFQAPFFAGTTGLTATAAGLRPFAYNINFAPGVAGNPFTTNARYVGVFQDMGTRNNDITSDSFRGVVGAQYQVGDWYLDSAAGLSMNKVTSINENRITLAGTSSVFGVPSTSQPPVPTSTSSAYNLNTPASNTDAVRDRMLIDFPRTSKSRLAFLDTKGSTTIGKMNGGDVGLAVGAEIRKESLIDSPDVNATSGNILGQGITATNGARTNGSVYGELQLPFSKSVEVQVAARHDAYSDYGSSTTPKVGMKWTPNDKVAIRANWGKGFRAPTLPEISPSVATFFTAVIDPEDDTARNVSGVFAGNPNLKAETSTSRVLGAVFQPTKDVRFAVDYYAITWRDVVASDSFQNIIDASCPNGPPCPSTANVIRDPANANQVVTILSNYENLSVRKTSGVDVDLEVAMPTNHGKYTFRTSAIYVRSFKEDGVEYVGTNGGSNTIPRIRGNVAVDFDSGGWGMTGRLNYTHSVYQQLLPASYFTAQDPRFQTGVYPDRVGSYTTLDLFARYKFNKNLTFSMSIINALDKTPPYDPGFSGTSLHDFSLHDIRGRRIGLGLQYKM